MELLYIALFPIILLVSILYLILPFLVVAISGNLKNALAELREINQRLKLERLPLPQAATPKIAAPQKIAVPPPVSLRISTK